MFRRAVEMSLMLWATLAASSIAANPEIPITGRVLGPDGEPLSKVAVRLEPIPSTHERARLRLTGQPGPDAVERDRTAADGTFDLTAPEAGMWKVVVAAPGLLTMEYRLVPLVEAAVLPDVALTRAVEVEVRVVDAAGKPRPASVGAFDVAARGEGWQSQLRLATAGEDGVARLPVRRDEHLHLEVLADGHPLVITQTVAESPATVEAPAGVAVMVRVTDRQKRPITGAVVYQGSALLPLGLSDEEGKVTLVLGAKAPAAVEVMTADRWSGSFTLDPTTHRETVRDLQLDPPDRVSGRVLDLPSREPVPGALVWALRGESVVADAAGRYTLEMDTGKTRWVYAAAAGYERAYAEMSGGEETRGPTLALAPTAQLSGKVTDGKGGLLAGVAIEVRPQLQGGRVSRSAYRMAEGLQSRTSQRGTFRLNGLPTGIGYRLRFTAEGFAPRTVAVDPLDAAENRTGLEVVLEPGRRGVGRVVDEGDMPIVGAEVALQAPPPSGDLMASMRMMSSGVGDPAPTHATDAEGRFEIADLATGSYDLEVRATGFAPARVPGVRVAEGSGEVDFGTLVLVPGASLEGRVTDPAGGAIAGAKVTVGPEQLRFSGLRPARPPAEAATDAEGRFVIADLMPGQPVALTVSKEGYGSAAMSGVRPPTEEPLKIEMEPAGRLVGKVLDEKREPIEGATVRTQLDFREMISRAAMQRHQNSGWARTATDGSFTIENAEPGAQQVTVEAKDYQQQIRQGIEVAPGAEIELEFVLERGAVIEGRVVTADGEPVVEAFIQASEQSDSLYGGHSISAHARTDAEGRYRITGAPIGLATIVVHHGDTPRLRKSLEVKPGSNTVDLVLERGFEISGQVVGPDGTPIRGAAVSIQSAATGPIQTFFGTSQAVSADGGAFALSDVEPGKYVISASLEGYAPGRSETFEVSADVTGLLLELQRGATLKGRVLGLEFDELGSLVVAAFSQQGGMRQGRVDFSGEYVLDSLAPGQWHVQARVTGSGRSSMMQVEVPEGVPEVEKDIEFGGGLTLTGVVLEDGQPLAGAQVFASSSENSGLGTTGADGRFQIDNLQPGGLHLMVIIGAGFQHTETLELAADHDLRIEISSGVVAGTVRDAASGESLAGAAVILERLDGDDTSFLGRRHGLGAPVESDSRGYFRVPRVRTGSWRVVVTKPGYGPGEATVTVASGSAPEIEIRLTATEGVSFEVALASGLTVPTVQIAILDLSSRRLGEGTYTVVDGKVRVSTVPPGRWDLVVQGGDSAAIRFAVNAPGDQGRLVLPTGGILHLRVPELEKEVLAKVRLTGPDGKPFVTPLPLAFAPGEWMMSGGQAMVPGLAPGVWTFSVEHGDGRTWNGSATVSPGDTTEVSLP